jgi:chromosome segregation ATPase
MPLLTRLTLLASMTLPTCEQQRQTRQQLDETNAKVAALHAEQSRLNDQVIEGLRGRPAGSNSTQVSAQAYAKGLAAELAKLKTDLTQAQASLQSTRSSLEQAKQRRQWAAEKLQNQPANPAAPR